MPDFCAPPPPPTAAPAPLTHSHSCAQSNNQGHTLPAHSVPQVHDAARASDGVTRKGEATAHGRRLDMPCVVQWRLCPLEVHETTAAEPATTTKHTHIRPPHCSHWGSHTSKATFCSWPAIMYLGPRLRVTDTMTPNRPKDTTPAANSSEPLRACTHRDLSVQHTQRRGDTHAARDSSSVRW
jgi:hypothetical protein